MDIIKRRQQKNLQKQAAKDARLREIRLWKEKGYTRADIAEKLGVPESSINKMYKDA